MPDLKTGKSWRIDCIYFA